MKHTARLTACLLALALTACRHDHRDSRRARADCRAHHRNTRRTGHAYANLHDLGRVGGPGCCLQRNEH